MLLKDNYYWFKQAISKQDCDKILKLGISELEKAHSIGQSTTAITYGNQDKSSIPDGIPQGEFTKQQVKDTGLSEKQTYVRDSNVVWLKDRWLYDLLFPFVYTANQKTGWNWEWDYAEHLQFTQYKPNQFYSWHKDGVSDHSGIYKRYIYGINQEALKDDLPPAGYVTDNSMVGKVRKISMTISLNDPTEYEGGNLKFDFGHHTSGDRFHECEEIRPQGSVIVFPSFLDHCVTPVTKGVRYSLVMWCLGRPFK
jgi:PKHD-type hydroxylase